MQANLRRDFLTSSASGIGGIALSHFLSQETFANANLSKNPHFSPKTKNCIFIFMAGAPSQLDLFDYKPKLNELDGKKMDAELLKGKQFAFLQKESAVLMGYSRNFHNTVDQVCGFRTWFQIYQSAQMIFA